MEHYGYNVLKIELHSHLYTTVKEPSFFIVYDNRIYILCCMSHKIYVHNLEGEYIFSFNVNGYIYSHMIIYNELLYVLTHHNAHIIVCDLNGTFLRYYCYQRQPPFS